MEKEEDKKSKVDQAASGSYIAQASNAGIASIRITQNAELKPLPAVSPPPPPFFTGRRQHLEAMADLLLSRKTRALGLVGMGGIGKTAAAKKFAEEFSQTYSGGIFWASLPDTSGDSLLILRTWALVCAYELPESLGIESAIDLVRGLLTQRIHERGDILFVIDDVRRDWLLAAQQIKSSLPLDFHLIITTRNESLALLLDSEILHLTPLATDEAVSFLKDLIQFQQVALSDEDAEAIVDLLGRLPLAIELAGKRLSRSLRKPGYQLKDLKLQLLTQASDVLQLHGHPGLTKTFSITYEALENTSRIAFRWLGAFAPGPIFLVDLEGILKLGASLDFTDESSLEEIMEDLVQLSLIEWGVAPDSYSIHPLLRQYAYSLLDNGKEIQNAKIAHRNYYKELLLRVVPNTSIANSALVPYLGNFLLAATTAREDRDIVTFLDLVKNLASSYGLLYTQGYWDTADGLLNQAIELIHDEALAAQLLCYLGIINREKGQYIKAKELFLSAIDKAQTNNSYQVLVDSLVGLGYVHLYLSEYTQAHAILSRAKELAEKTANEYGVGESLRGLARVALSVNDRVVAESLFQESIPVLQRSGNSQGLIYAMRGLGETLALQGKIEPALDALHEAIRLAEAAKDMQAVGYILRALGNLYAANGQKEEAKFTFRECIKICQRIGERGSLVASQCLLADVLVETSDLEEAQLLFQNSLELASSLGLNRWASRALFGLAKIQYKQGNIESGLADARHSLESLRSIMHRDAELVESWIQEHDWEHG